MHGPAQREARLEARLAHPYGPHGLPIRADGRLGGQIQQQTQQIRADAGADQDHAPGRDPHIQALELKCAVAMQPVAVPGPPNTEHRRPSTRQ